MASQEPVWVRASAVSSALGKVNPHKSSKKEHGYDWIHANVLSGNASDVSLPVTVEISDKDSEFNDHKVELAPTSSSGIDPCSPPSQW